MRKVLSLVLVIAMCLSFAACKGDKKTPDEISNTTSATILTTIPTTAPTTVPTTEPTTKPTTPPPDWTNVTAENSPYRGKTLCIGGMNPYAFGKMTNQGMMLAAMEEWAAMNGVTLEYSSILSDVEIEGSKFPKIALGGENTIKNITFTDTEYEKLASVCGNTYLDMLGSYGVIFPWSPTTVCFYNKTLFEDCGVKTPQEYFLEGNWTWETFRNCMGEMTRDIDNDGTIDVYGISRYSFDGMVYSWKLDSNGELVSGIDEPWVEELFQMKKDAFGRNKTVNANEFGTIHTQAYYPMCAMSILDCNVYELEQLYRSNGNGHEIEVVPVPVWVGSNGERMPAVAINQFYGRLSVNCRNRDAAVDMLAYVLQCGMKFMADSSLGGIQCDYPGIQGTCDVSKQWKEAFDKTCEEGAKKMEELGADETAYMKALNTYMFTQPKYTYYPELPVLTQYEEVLKSGTSKAIERIKAEQETFLEAYNKKLEIPVRG